MFGNKEGRVEHMPLHAFLLLASSTKQILLVLIVIRLPVMIVDETSMELTSLNKQITLFFFLFLKKKDIQPIIRK